MTKKIPARKLEALSAYLDGELSHRASQRLEVEIERDAELRAALDDLKRTRAVLRRAPRLRAPRNFTLSPELAGVQTQRRSSAGAYALLRTASALAAILFVVAVMGEWFMGSVGPAMAPAAQDVAFAPVPSIGEVEEAPAERVEKFALPKERPSPELELEAAAEEPVMDAAPQTEAVEALALSPTLTPTLLPTETSLPTPPPTHAPAGEAATGGWDYLRLLQISLAIVAVAAGVGAVYVRRKAGRP